MVTGQHGLTEVTSRLEESGFRDCACSSLSVLFANPANDSKVQLEAFLPQQFRRLGSTLGIIAVLFVG